MPTQLFIVDDHYMVIEGIHSLLKDEKGMEWLGHATNAASCMAFLQKQQPDVILMDINLPDVSGIELCRLVKEKYPAIFVIGLSTFNQYSLIEKMIASGASGYLLKNATREELVEAIQTVSNRKTYFSKEAAQTMRKDDSLKIVLTRREKEVLELIADGMTNNEIAQKLFISVTTVETHRRNLLTKFDAKNIVSLVKTAIQLQIIQ
ncbi:response regulator transcription factor [Paraflavitalea sp. CAU 1676]|uniref:response regulator n=1 Tax=Paraflavitalea sp. CAU 1676 TaxID=3032598 RepID=UPI0023D9D6F2|nr:response regulator transcription factor [Paraflavitalea sp. CAU 1676]MDF2187823.1 response regulator transcription factor [Paraflavitalea sp. CAU 1676]